MTFLIWLVLALPVGFIAGALGMALWLVLKPLVVTGVRVGIRWIKATLTGGL